MLKQEAVERIVEEIKGSSGVDTKEILDLCADWFEHERQLKQLNFVIKEWEKRWIKDHAAGLDLQAQIFLLTSEKAAQDKELAEPDKLFEHTTNLNPAKFSDRMGCAYLYAHYIEELDKILSESNDDLKRIEEYQNKAERYESENKMLSAVEDADIANSRPWELKEDTVMALRKRYTELNSTGENEVFCKEEDIVDSPEINVEDLESQIEKDTKYLMNLNSLLSRYSKEDGSKAVWQSWKAKMGYQNRKVKNKLQQWPIPELDKELDTWIAYAVVDDFLGWAKNSGIILYYKDKEKEF